MASTPGTFEVGSSIVIREVLHGKVWTSRPVTVIEDSPRQFVSWLAPGTIIDYPMNIEHGATCFKAWQSREWEVSSKEFVAPGMLRIAPSDAPFEVFAPVDLEEGVLSWYVNFEQPLVRTSVGFDTMDETLDLLVTRDLSNWERKDDDELDLALTMDVITVITAARVRHACSMVEAALSRGEAPWDTTWATWTPTTK